MKDLRGFSRVTVNTVCNVYIGSKLEITSKLINISESGVLLEIPYVEGLMDYLKLGCKLKFQGLAKPQDGSTYIYQETAKVVRIEPTNNILRVACKVSGRDVYYSTYVKVLKALKIL